MADVVPGLSEAGGITSCEGDLLIKGDCYIAGDAEVADDLVVSEDLHVGGTVTESTGVENKYFLQSQDLNVSGANDTYMVVPADGAGDIVAIHFVTTIPITTTESNITLYVNGDASDATIEVPISLAGVSTTVAIAAGATNKSVVANDYIRLLADGVPAAGVVNVTVEIDQS